MVLSRCQMQFLAAAEEIVAYPLQQYSEAEDDTHSGVCLLNYKISYVMAIPVGLISSFEMKYERSPNYLMCSRGNHHTPNLVSFS